MQPDRKQHLSTTPPAFGRLSLLALWLSLTTGHSLEAAAAAVPPGAELAPKQAVVRNNGDEPSSLDPHRVESNVEFAIISDIFEGLVGTANDGSVEPRLAERWEQTSPNVWVFHLRPGLRWSNGLPITAEDIVYSWRRLIDPATASPCQSYLAAMQVLNAQAILNGKKTPDTLGVRSRDAVTLEVTLAQSLPYFLSMLAHPILVPVHRDTLERHGVKWTRPENFVGSGPFKVEEWRVNEKLVAHRSPTYWDNANTVLEKVTYLPIVSETAEVNRYKAGEIDITNSVPEILFSSLKKELGDQVKVSPTLGTYLYEFNTTKPPFNDSRVRLALNLGLDKEIIASSVLGQGQTAAYSLLPANIGGFHFKKPDYAGWPQQYRNATAKKLLEQAGYDAANPLTFALLYNTSESHQRVAIAASSMWKKNLGVVATLNNQEWKTLLDTLRGNNFDLVRYTWLADYNEPTSFLNNYQSQNSGNQSKYHNPHYDLVLRKAQESSTPAEVAQYYQQAEDILANDCPAIPIYHYMGVKLVKPYIGGFYENPLGYISSKNLYVLKH